VILGKRLTTRLPREHAGRNAQPGAMIPDSRTLQSAPESEARAGYDPEERDEWHSGP